MYITQANLNRLFDSVTCNTIGVQELLSSHPKLHELLSEPELKQLTAIEGIVAGDTTLEILRIEGIRNYNNTNYVYQNSTTPYYHTNNQCPRLSNNYINVLIPEKIKMLGNAEMGKYRGFFPAQNPNDSDEIKMQKVQIGANAVRAHYLYKGIELSEHEIFEVISRKHTDTIDASTAIDLNGRIHEYKEFLDNIKHSDNPQIKNIYHARYINNKDILKMYKNRSDDEKFYVLQMQKLRKEILSLAINQLILIHEFDENNLNQKVLKELGFKYCSHCAAKMLTKQFF